jgi:5-methylcytosine-specific restriction endonuclease McrA
MPRSKGRTGRPWRRARKQVLDKSRTCWLCGHDGATDADHNPPLKQLEAAGLNPADPRYLRPAHGAAGCPTCSRKCNQEKGARTTPPAPHTSRAW